MLSKGTGFANYSKGLCWVVSFIWLGLAVLSFTGDSPNGAFIGLFWLAGAIAFAVSAFILQQRSQKEEGSGSTES
ncbi:MAG: hypothetical protein AB8B95_08850 [Pseudohongiellaceae bacterium]